MLAHAARTGGFDRVEPCAGAHLDYATPNSGIQRRGAKAMAAIVEDPHDIAFGYSSFSRVLGIDRQRFASL